MQAYQTWAVILGLAVCLFASVAAQMFAPVLFGTRYQLFTSDSLTGAIGYPLVLRLDQRTGEIDVCELALTRPSYATDPSPQMPPATQAQNAPPGTKPFAKFDKFLDQFPNPDTIAHIQCAKDFKIRTG